MLTQYRSQLALVAALALGGCGSAAKLQVENGTGPDPTLPPPEKSLIPTVNIAPAVGWPDGGKPVAADGTQVVAFADKLDHPRWLYVLPNGDVLVAEPNAPERPEDGKGIKGFFMKKAMKRAGSAVPSANRITLLRDTDGDGVADLRSAFLANLNSPFGMALVGDDALRREHRRAGALPVPRTATRRSRPRAPRSPTCPAARSTITGPRTSSRAATARSST